MMRNPKAYWAIMRASMITGLVYRFGFLFSIVGNIVYMCVAYFLWQSIYRYSPTLHGLTFNDAFIYVVLGSTVFILLKSYVEWDIAREISDGKIAIYLTKPLDYQLLWLFNNLGYALTNLVAITLPTGLLLTLVFKVTITPGPGLMLFPLSLLMAFLISYNIDYTIGLTAFYTESTWGLSIMKDLIVSLLAGALLPLQFFPDAIQKVLLWLPFQAIYYTPLTMISQPDLSWGTLLVMLLVQLVWVLVMFIFTRVLYQQAIKVLRVSGG
jgi:ABC-2 type transport system permease protein